MDKPEEKKRKKKGKDYVKKMAFLRGKDEPPLPKANAATSKQFGQLLEELTGNSLNSTTNKSKEKEPSQDDLSELEKPAKKLSNELVIGLQSVMRKISSKKLVGVILTDPLTIHIQFTLRDMCFEERIPFLLLPKLDTFKSTLRISKLTCIAFYDLVLEPDSLCHKLYSLFQQSLLSHNQEYSFTDPCLSSCQLSSIPVHLQDEIKSETKQEKFEFHIPPLDDLMILSENIDEVLKITPKLEQKTLQPLEERDFILIDSSEKRKRFPDRPYFKNYNVKLKINVLPSTSNESSDFGKSLFISEPKSILNVNELNLLPSQKNVELFRKPKVVHLPVSGKSKKRKIKRQKT